MPLLIAAERELLPMMPFAAGNGVWRLVGAMLLIAVSDAGARLAREALACTAGMSASLSPARVFGPRFHCGCCCSRRSCLTGPTPRYARRDRIAAIREFCRTRFRLSPCWAARSHYYTMARHATRPAQGLSDSRSLSHAIADYATGLEANVAGWPIHRSGALPAAGNRLCVRSDCDRHRVG